MSRMSGTERRLAGVALALLGATAALPASAQPLFKYQGPDGIWVFADRPPDAGQVYEEIPVERPESQGLIRIHQRRGGDGIYVLAAENRFLAPMQIAFRLETTENLAPQVPTQGNRVLDARSDTELLRLLPDDYNQPIRITYRYQYVHGAPGVRHEPEGPYRLPYALANGHQVTQAFPDQVTHTDAANLHAVDFDMPIGTGVYAARAGIVIEVASDNFEAGLDVEDYGSRANIVRILHADGTIALYGHLNWNSIRVGVGQAVARGEYIADSGNTGYSTGPHLHFVVQRNAGGRVESVPVEFAGPGGDAITVTTGDRPIAY